jgi:hypothetical protein
MTTHDPKLLHNGVLAVRRNTIRRLLHTVFGIEHLRDGQQRVIDSVLDGKDTLAIMPTGSGKSLCYQIPARIKGGMTVVVSPLISLMKDQLEKLGELGIRATQVNSSLSAEEERTALAAIAEERCEIVFCTPERLAMPDFVDVLKPVRIALVVVDEAHCISQWGHDFRPAYLEMAGAIDALGSPPVLALTATATEDVIDDIGRQLNRPRMKVINTGIYRPNLHYGVVQVTNPAEKLDEALGRAEYDLAAALRDCRQCVPLLFRRQAAVDLLGADVEFPELFQLVFHERDQRRDDDRHAVEDTGGNLVAQRFTAAGRHDRQRVPAIEDAVDHALLAVAQVFDAEHRMQQAANGVAAYREHTLVEEFGIVCGHDDANVSLSTATHHRTQPTATVGGYARATPCGQTERRGLFLQVDGLPADSFSKERVLR